MKAEACYYRLAWRRRQVERVCISEKQEGANIRFVIRALRAKWHSE